MKKSMAAGVLAAAALALPGRAAAEPRKLAFLVGINDYKAVTDLRGCVNDVERMRTVLVNRFGFADADIVVLKDKDATREAILRTFRTHLIDQAAAGTIVVFHYSGHGSRMTDQSGDEREDGWDETIVPHDSRQGGVVDITDDDLNVLMTDLVKKTTNVTAILDSCHSGSATRGGALARRIPDLVLPAAPAPAPGRATGEGASEMRPDGASYVLISGSAPQELSNEFFMGGKPYGALSYYLTEALGAIDGESTYRELFEVSAPQVTAAFPTQHPQIEGARSDTVLFGDRTVTSEAHFRVSKPNNRLTVNGGAIHGLGEKTLLDVYAANVRVFRSPNTPIAQIELTRVDDFTSEAKVLSGSEPPVGARAVVRSSGLPPSRLRVHYCVLQPSPAGQPRRCTGTSAALDAVRTAAGKTGLMDVVASESEAQMIVQESGGKIHFLFGDLAEASAPVAATDVDFATTASDKLAKWAKWHAVLALANPASTLSVSVETRHKGVTGPVPSVTSGDDVDFRVKNTSTVAVYLTLLDVSTDGSIGVLVSPVGGAAHQPGATLDWGIRFTVPPGRSSVTDTIKVLATTAPINTSVFEQAAIKGAPSTDLVAQAFETAFQGNKTGTIVSKNNWTTASTSIHIGAARRAPAGVDAFAFHVPEGTRSLDPSVRGVLGDCSVNPNDCWEPEPLGPPGTFVLRRKGGDRDADGVPSSGEAWEAAYRLRKQTNAIRVEPLPEIDSRAWNEEEQTGTRGGRTRPDKPAAAGDSGWSLTHISVDKAWKLLRDKGAADGQEAKGIVVGHPDTGYRPHDEVWNGDPAKRPILDADGYDFEDDDHDAKDPLETTGFIPNPGHGTKSGSVIVSPKGRQMPGGQPTEFVTGVAPGARLVPLRVNKSVVHFKTGNLAKAISNAAGDDRTLVKRKADVISISMGGLPGWSLWKSVKFARDKGVIVVAAAGNEVKTVVWPARFKEVVAVSASNVECGLWEGASHGGAVDITAPGESVWRASTDPPGVDSIGMGQGTTFATATVAGVAALWLAYHRDASGQDSPEMQILKRDGLVTGAFRDALKAGAWRPDQANTIPAGVHCAGNAPWPTDEYGAGIVNAEGVLEARLTLGSRGGDSDDIEELPLFASLFPDGTPAATVADRYAALFGAANARAAAPLAELEGEISHLYATDTETAAALDAFVGGGPAAPARQTLLRKDISPSLRAALTAPPPAG
jgi:hypothetical protein